MKSCVHRAVHAAGGGALIRRTKRKAFFSSPIELSRWRKSVCRYLSCCTIGLKDLVVALQPHLGRGASGAVMYKWLASRYFWVAHVNHMEFGEHRS